MRSAPKDKNGQAIIPPPIVLEERPGIITQVREYELITPLFGGGVEPGQCDDLTPIRGTEIRGHLRFWWRATRGGNPLFEGKLEKMKEKEDEIWGAASTKDQAAPSAVKVSVIYERKQATNNPENDENLDRPFAIVRGKVEPRKGSVVPAYIAFPLQPSIEETAELGRSGKPTKGVRLNVKFKLEISFPSEQRQDVEAALWAWETFGGVGARTRRGFGALSLKAVKENNNNTKIDIPSSSDGVKAWIQKKLGDGDDGFNVKGKWQENVPRLPDISRFKITKAQAQQNNQRRDSTDYQSDGKTRELEVLAYLSEKLKFFRQSRYNKNVGIMADNVFGLSRWPEAEEIRRRLGINSRSAETNGIKKFPRAKLGLPIIFHLPHDDEEVELIGTKSNRRASPLIFRPLVCADGKVVGIAVVLAPTSLPPDQLRLKGINNNTDPIDVEPGADLYKIQPLHREKDIFKAFLDTL